MPSTEPLLSADALQQSHPQQPTSQPQELGSAAAHFDESSEEDPDLGPPEEFTFLLSRKGIIHCPGPQGGAACGAVSGSLEACAHPPTGARFCKRPSDTCPLLDL